MAESLMLIALGFLTATLFAIIAIQLVRRRAVAVTTVRVTQELKGADERAHEEVAASAARIAALEAKIAELASGNSAFADRNAELEQAAVVAAEAAEAQRKTSAHEAETLRRDIAVLQTQHEAARAQADRQSQELANLHAHADALRQRVAELEQAATAEVDRQSHLEQQLKSLGEKAARLVYEMNEAFAHVAEAPVLQAAISAPTPELTREPATGQVTTEAQPTSKLTPFPADELGAGFEELSAIKASLSSTFEPVAPTDFDDGDEDGLPGEMILAERIKALEAGVTS
ncbi:hypothetical protein F2P47_07355 [Parvibaculum sedimenti]|uniref:Uncharacterized protein n=1 Tax=Parvibaculum sedimenti TaxID=2608632 RepID=A0A6N6VNX9_9HYPH|nr:hypothetical protein [Parvibaculum sedimenti]KAB7740852.1 hypothetical protein F2P47_07355 [Parvibaculum sedimenti]